MEKMLTSFTYMIDEHLLKGSSKLLWSIFVIFMMIDMGNKHELLGLIHGSQLEF